MTIDIAETRLRQFFSVRLFVVDRCCSPSNIEVRIDIWAKTPTIEV